ncbi:iron transporter [Virgisporangium aliadipatigenens]|uniref:Iron transporter n=1 Tax=Virgisporangium aliadipatigenens TaxID=741659 RepID=A0A8J3YKK7_9ACTN|nr:IucA/IucC family siderophore biosynthesis protein [Virgisporangium aliadipatigenens]GIJ45630.1 iron transporter [Virgisporangium aliadipatigenens]
MGILPGLSAAERAHAAWLAGHRPDLAARYTTALPGARATVLAKLWGAMVREELPGRTAAAPDRVTINGHEVRGSAAAAQPFAAVAPQFSLSGNVMPHAVAATLWPERPAFAAELDESVANLALARAADPHRPVDPDSLVAAEQSVADGHPLHPCCRTRTGMDTADQLAYAPEHRPVVRLAVVEVPAGRWHGTLPPILPVHPWQWHRLREEFPWLRDTGRRLPARPLMSLRTFATADGHVKTSVDVRMTSAVRGVSAAAVHNGPVLSARLERLLRGTPIAVLAEPGAGSVLVDGAPYRGLAVVRRHAPTLGPDERALPFAALTAGRPSAAELVHAGYGGDPHAFLGHLAGLALPTLLRLLERGIGLEAHGQNLLLVVAHHRAARLLYRDLGGVRVHGPDAAGLTGDIPTDDPDAPAVKLLASFVSTVLAELVTHLARRFGTDPDGLWRTVLAAVPRDTPRRDVLLRPTLPLKALTAMRLHDTVEDIWTPLPNPMAR